MLMEQEPTAAPDQTGDENPRVSLRPALAREIT